MLAVSFVTSTILMNSCPKLKEQSYQMFLLALYAIDHLQMGQSKEEQKGWMGDEVRNWLLVGLLFTFQDQDQVFWWWW